MKKVQLDFEDSYHERLKAAADSDMRSIVSYCMKAVDSALKGLYGSTPIIVADTKPVNLSVAEKKADAWATLLSRATPKQVVGDPLWAFIPRTKYKDFWFTWGNTAHGRLYNIELAIKSELECWECNSANKHEDSIERVRLLNEERRAILHGEPVVKALTFEETKAIGDYGSIINHPDYIDLTEEEMDELELQFNPQES